MKTLKFLFLLTALNALWQSGHAQCASFNLWQSSPGSDTVVVYPYVSNVADSASATITIDFGDGITQTANGMAWHIYDSIGTYNICLSYTSGLCTSTVCDTVNVVDCSFAASLNVSQSTTAGVTTLTLSGAPVGSTYVWTLQSGSDTSTASSPTHSYPNGGVYYDYVTVTSPAGCTRTAGFTVSTDSICNASWTKSQYGNQVNVSALHYNTAAVYTWDFGDGQTAIGMGQSHNYASFGTYTVCLKVTTAGCVDSVCQTVTTSLPPCPSSDSLFIATPVANGGVFFISTIDSFFLYGANAITIKYGNGDSSYLHYNHTYQYPAGGTYSVCVTYTSNYCSVTQCDTVVVNQCNVSTAIYANVNGYAAYYNMENANPAWSYQWSFPGGSPSTSNSMAEYVLYAVPGTYITSVTITPPGCSPSSYIDTIIILDSCSAYFNYSTSGGASIWLTAADSFMITQPGHSYHFNYGDGTTGTGWSHTYASLGTYNVCLYVSTTTCADSFCRTVNLTAPSNVLSGRIYKGGNYACRGIAYLIEEDSTGHLTAIDTFIFGTPDTCYAYFMFNVQPGTYYVKAALTTEDADYANYLPTYYGDELNWADATAVTDYFNSNDINLIAGTNPGGPGFVGGYVSEGAGLGVIGNGEERAVGDPIANVQVNLLTDNGAAVAYTYTDGNGRYTFGNLALGSYKIHAEILDKAPSSQVVTLTANNPSQDNVDVLVNSNSAVTGINDIADIKVDGVFPNPVSENTTLQFTARQSASADMKITDMKGAVVMNKQIAITAGANKIDVNLSNHAAGVYHLSITNNANSKTIKLIKAN